ncbi:ATP-binding cassette domain-containing protein [Thiocapsa roseopersicina]|uniref:Zinc transport system ATP-binding protein n=1 Tax=Thiocapsa roseopersicina TaxID=1058 RepID=A0A1H2WAH4_THIRO|nr:ATP-binding cassette domain-containing protein [Thiocapsa roseopersicina]SDW77274.1 zinc transport system ATP-binding protein [Thiocapsa roseopersicina]
MSTPLLRVEGLVAGYGRPVVGPLSLDVFPGEVVGLWGANGCGKSTLLNAIADRADLLAGRILRMPGLVIAYQAQQPIRLPSMPVTGRELLRFTGTSLQEMPAALQAVSRQRIDRLSGGQYQLLCVWAAIAGRADLILLDEPTNNLDPEREALLTEMLTPSRLARRDTSGARLLPDRGVLLVSHERRFLEDACSRMIEIA